MALSKIKVRNVDDNAVHGRRNLVINGSMAIAQRGTSFTDADGIYTLDRYRLNSANEDEFVCDVSQSSDAPDGFSYSLKVDVTTAEATINSDERVSIEQRIEAQNLQHLMYGTANAKTTTLSMWVKSSVAGKYGVNIRAHDASDNYNASFTINTADTWEHKTMTIDGNTLSGGQITNDNGIGLWFRLMLICGSDHRTSTVDQWVADNSHNAPSDAQTTWGTSTSHEFYLTGVQWEVGEQASAFEHRSFGEELSLCQRYFTKFSWNGNYDAIGSGLIKNNGNEARIIVPLPVSMRSNPSASFTGTGLTIYDAANFDTSTTLQSTYSGRHSLMIDVNVSGLTANRPATLHVESSANAFNLDAEL